MSLTNLLKACDASAITNHMETLELAAAAAGRPHPHPTEHLLALLLLPDHREAHFLYKRLSAREQTQVAAVWAVAQPLLTHNRPAFFAATAAAVSCDGGNGGGRPQDRGDVDGDGESGDGAGLNDCDGATLPKVLHPMLTELVRRERRKALTLVSRAFDTISVDALCKLIGVTDGQVDALCYKLHWRRDGDFIVIPSHEDDEYLSSGDNKWQADGDFAGTGRDRLEGFDIDGIVADGENGAIGTTKNGSYAQLQILTEQLVKLQTT